jgi:hypothetical protein
MRWECKMGYPESLSLFWDRRRVLSCPCVSNSRIFTTLGTNIMPQKAASNFLRLIFPPSVQCSRDSAVGLVTKLRAGHLTNRGSIPSRRDILFSEVSRPIWGPPRLLFYTGREGGGGSGRGVKLTTHLHPVLRLRMCGAIPLSPHMPSWRAHRQLNIHHQ